MSNQDLSNQIAGLEDEIEKLRRTLDNCRKAMLLAKIAIAAGAVWTLAYFLGTIWVSPAAMIGAVATVLSGIVVFGASSRTWRDTAAALEAAERDRNRLIDIVSPRIVG